MSEYSVTFIFPTAVVTTMIAGDIAIVERAAALLKEDLGVDCSQAQETSVHELPKGT